MKIDYCESNFYVIYLFFQIVENGTSHMGTRSSDQYKDVPEWKRAVQSGTRTGAVGKKIVRSLLEQRQSLPIFKLKDELLKVGISIVLVHNFYS